MSYLASGISLNGYAKLIEEIKDSVELRADWVAGFWNGNDPKQEPECQNVLWPTVKQKLLNLGIANIEEKFIGANKCDFWVLFPRKDAPPYQVAVELKVARNKYDRAELIDPMEKISKSGKMRIWSLHRPLVQRRETLQGPQVMEDNSRSRPRYR